jgi:hypothetical protein
VNFEVIDRRGLHDYQNTKVWYSSKVVDAFMLMKAIVHLGCDVIFLYYSLAKKQLLIVQKYY